MSKTQYTLAENLILKTPVPARGIICSNPRRAERIATSHLAHDKLLKEYHSAWQLDIYLGEYEGVEFFVAGVAVGAAGAAFAIQQLASAGAKYIIRYGSNDDPKLTKERMQEVILVDQADNLYGLMQGSGAPQERWGETLFASSVLIEALQKKSQELNLATRLAICHHIEDYAAYAFPEKSGKFSKHVLDHLAKLESKNTDRIHSRDMESAALFYRAELDGFHAATVLQNIPKFAGSHQTYDGEQGEIAKKMEIVFCDLIFGALQSFKI
jgi:uridine phosphorylase